jgi:hypothetical protein
MNGTSRYGHPSPLRRDRRRDAALTPYLRTVPGTRRRRR